MGVLCHCMVGSVSPVSLFGDEKHSGICRGILTVRELADKLGVTYFHEKRNLILGHQLLPLLRQFNRILYKQHQPQEQQIFNGYQLHTAWVLHGGWGRIGWGSDLQQV